MLPELVGQMTAAAEASKPLPQVPDHNGLMQTVDFDKTRPFIAAFEVMCHNTEYWKKHVGRNVMRAAMAKLQGTNVVETEDKKAMKFFSDRVSTCRRTSETSWATTRAKENRQTRRLGQQAKPQEATDQPQQVEHNRSPPRPKSSSG